MTSPARATESIGLHILIGIDRILRGLDSATQRWTRLAMLIFASSAFYGAVMGSFASLNAERYWQVIYAAIKTPMLILATFAIGLPSLWMFYTLAGLRSEFGRVVAGLMRTQAVVGITLASLAPYTVLWYASVDGYQSAVAFNGLIFLLASLAGQLALRRTYRGLVEREPRHRPLFWVWFVLYVFIGIQMAWTLRPFIGTPIMTVAFLRPDTFGNAYMQLFGLIVSLIGS